MGGRRTHVLLEQVCFKSLDNNTITHEYGDAYSLYSSRSSSPMSIPSVTTYSSHEWGELQSTSASSTDEMPHLFPPEEHQELLINAQHSFQDVIHRMQNRIDQLSIRNSIIQGRCRLALLSLSRRHDSPDDTFILQPAPQRPCSAPPRLCVSSFLSCDNRSCASVCSSEDAFDPESAMMSDEKTKT